LGGTLRYRGKRLDVARKFLRKERIVLVVHPFEPVAPGFRKVGQPGVQTNSLVNVLNDFFPFFPVLGIFWSFSPYVLTRCLVPTNVGPYYSPK